MKDASPAAQSLVEQAKFSRVSVGGLTTATNTSRLAMVGMRVATIALNAALIMLVVGAISGLDYILYITRKSKQKRLKSK